MSKRLSRSETKKLVTAIGAKIFMQRNIKGYSVEKLALKCGMAPQHLHDIEAGKINIMMTTLNQIPFSSITLYYVIQVRAVRGEGLA